MAILKAKAKVNLFFHITGKRNDSYHLIDSLMVFTQDLYDLIEIKPSETNHTEIIGGEFAYLLENENNNLIDKAIQAFSTKEKYYCSLTKNIPIGAGLGGGSSDAAIVAKFLNQNLNNHELAKIGADLPICYHAEPAFCSGIGEIIEPIVNFPLIYLVLINPRKALLTTDVFKANTSIDTPKTLHHFFKNAEQLIEFLSLLHNNLTDAAILLMPEIKEVLGLLLRQDGCRISRMSGSGPTCFGLFTDKHKAIEASENLTKLKPEYWIKYSAV